MRIEKILANTLLLLLSFVFTFGLIEVGANYYLWNIATDEQFAYYASVNQVKERFGEDFYVNETEQTRYSPHHYIGFVNRPNYQDEENRHNSLGFRGDEITVEKPAETYRVVAIGESTTYGTSVNYDESYPYQLQEYLNVNNYPNVEVVNAGVGSYTSYETLMTLQFRALDLDPDLIIVYQGSNDIHTRLVAPPEAYKGDNSGFRDPFVQDVTMPHIWEYSTALRMIGLNMGAILSHSSLEWTRFRRADTVVGRLYRQQYDNKTYPDGIFLDTPAIDILNANPPIYFERNVRNMAEIAHANGADILFITYVISNEFESANVNSPVYLQGLDDHNEVTRQVARETDSYFFDITDVFPEDEKYFTDGRHMTIEGNQLRAELIGDFLIELDILPE